MNVGIIGAGPAGLSAAYRLAGQGVRASVLEAGSAVGGLARSIELWGQQVDVGPHRFFSRDRRVNGLWLEVVGSDYEMVRRITRILYDGKLFRYPIEGWDALSKLGPRCAAGCLWSYAKEVVRPTPDDGSFESWVCRRFGRRLYEIFFRTYSERLWGIPCRDLDADFAAQRIRGFSLLEAIKGAVTIANRGAHRTLADRFAYPVGGTGMVYERMAEAVRSRGGDVRVNEPVRRVLLENRRVRGLELESGEVVGCDQVISSMPLTRLVMQFEGVPNRVLEACRHLRFRNTILVYLEVLEQNPFPDQWIYVHSRDLQVGRVTNFRNWVRATCGESPHSILCLEYWCNADDKLWREPDAELEELGVREIVQSGLVGSCDGVGRRRVLRIPKSYPVYRRGYREHLEVIREFLRHIEGLQVIGRYGSFKYNNQDHSILMGCLAAENALGHSGHDLWSVNTDYESYQEACEISETGLVPVTVPEAHAKLAEEFSR